MKKLFVCVMASLCSAFALAQKDEIVMENVNLSSGGTETLYVKFKNPTKYTAFQFDLTLPKGVSVEEVGMGGSVPSTRKIEKGLIDAGTNKYRFLSYDMENANLVENTSLKITLKAGADLTEGVAETSEGLLVTPGGESAEQDVASASVTIKEVSVDITIGASGKTTYVSKEDLDFSGLTDVKAYIATSYDLATSEVWLTRVTDVPAGTPIWVSGPAGTVTVPTATSTTYYPENLLKGSATEKVNIPAEDANYLCWTLGSDGDIAPRSGGATGFPAGKAYLQLPKDVKSNVGTEESLKMSAKGKKSYVGLYDLDFSGVTGLKAYIVTGYSEDGTIWLTRVMKASGGTPLYLTGDPDVTYSVPSKTVKMAVVNMLKGDASNKTDLKAVDGEFTTCTLSSSDGTFNPLSKDVTGFPAGLAYLPLPTAYIKAGTRGMTERMEEVEAEMICISLVGNETGIDRVHNSEMTGGEGVWYNLNGQRIDKPAKKGLYIRNGKKVIVK